MTKAFSGVATAEIELEFYYHAIPNEYGGDDLDQYGEPRLTIIIDGKIAEVTGDDVIEALRGPLFDAKLQAGNTVYEELQDMASFDAEEV